MTKLVTVNWNNTTYTYVKIISVISIVIHSIVKFAIQNPVSFFITLKWFFKAIFKNTNNSSLCLNTSSFIWISKQNIKKWSSLHLFLIFLLDKYFLILNSMCCDPIQKEHWIFFFAFVADVIQNMWNSSMVECYSNSISCFILFCFSL